VGLQTSDPCALSQLIFWYDRIPVRRYRLSPTDWKSIVQFNSTPIADGLEVHRTIQLDPVTDGLEVHRTIQLDPVTDGLEVHRTIQLDPYRRRTGSPSYNSTRPLSPTDWKSIVQFNSTLSPTDWKSIVQFNSTPITDGLEVHRTIQLDPYHRRTGSPSYNSTRPLSPTDWKSIAQFNSTLILSCDNSSTKKDFIFKPQALGLRPKPGNTGQSNGSGGHSHLGQDLVQYVFA
jgi:hypothetical protein